MNRQHLATLMLALLVVRAGVGRSLACKVVQRCVQLNSAEVRAAGGRMDSEREEGEMSDESMSVEAVQVRAPAAVRAPSLSPSPPPSSEYTILYRAEKHGLIVEKLEKTDTSKLEERARRFGINLSGSKVITQGLIDELYENIGVNDTNERHFRFDTLHLKGVTDLTTKEVFEYLEDYRPVSLERINKSACNVMCQDHISAALAILVHSREIKDEDVKTIAECCPPYHWREGLPHSKSSLILIRFATRSDKLESDGALDEEKMHGIDVGQSNDIAGKNPWGDLCKSWGVYDHQEVYGPKLPPIKSYIKTEAGIIRKQSIQSKCLDEEPIIPPRITNRSLAKRLGKRQCDVEISEEESSSDDEWKKKSKVPRMRMRADDEEDKKKSKQFVVEEHEVEQNYPSLSIQIDNVDEKNIVADSGKTLSEKFKDNQLKNRLGNTKIDIQSRLGDRVNNKKESSRDSRSSSSPEMNVMSRVQRAPVNKKLSSVWTRLDKAETQTDLRQTLKSKPKYVPKSTITDDLRQKLKERNKNNRSPLRIEIDNEYYESD